jgi:hypothetical protein
LASVTGYQDAVAFSHGFSVALWVGAGAAVVAALLALTLRRASELAARG